MLKWVGHLKGIECLYGIPARDLTDEEAEQYGGREYLIGRGYWIEEEEREREISSRDHRQRRSQ